MKKYYHSKIIHLFLSTGLSQNSLDFLCMKMIITFMVIGFTVFWFIGELYPNAKNSDIINKHRGNHSQPKSFKNKMGIEFVLIPSGEFDMGSPSNEPGRDNSEEPVHRVHIDYDFYLSKYEITQEQWTAIAGKNPSFFKTCGKNCPVETVNWYEAVWYANELSWRDKLEFCYQLMDCNGKPAIDLLCRSERFRGIECKGYRLPTEAEWEYASRAGTRSAIYTGDDLITDGDCNSFAIDKIGWYCGNSSNKTHPIGLKTPNDFGLYDMIGNVSEWVQDWYHDSYEANMNSINPTGPENGLSRIARGASFINGSKLCRCAHRDFSSPGLRASIVGFRLAITLPKSKSMLNQNEKTLLNTPD